MKDCTREQTERDIEILTAKLTAVLTHGGSTSDEVSVCLTKREVAMLMSVLAMVIDARPILERPGNLPRERAGTRGTNPKEIK